MSRWLDRAIPRVTVNRDAGPSWITCSHRGKCGCEEASERACRELLAAREAASAPAQTPAAPAAPTKPAKPRTWRDVMDGAGGWRDTLARVVEALRQFPDAARAVFLALEPSDAPA